MTVNIWKSYVWTADKDVNIKAIFVLMNTTCAVMKIRPEKKFRPVRDLNLWLLRYRCSALPTELTSQLRAEFFFKPYFHYCSSSVHYREDRFYTYVFIRCSNIWLSYITVVCSSIHGFIWYQHNDLPQLSYSSPIPTEATIFSHFLPFKVENNKSVIIRVNQRTAILNVVIGQAQIIADSFRKKLYLRREGRTN